jgi:hypothetical protein
MQIIGSDATKTIPNLIRNLKIHTASFTASASAVNSAFTIRISYSISLEIIPAHWTKIQIEL